MLSYIYTGKWTIQNIYAQGLNVLTQVVMSLTEQLFRKDYLPQRWQLLLFTWACWHPYFAVHRHEWDGKFESKRIANEKKKKNWRKWKWKEHNWIPKREGNGFDLKRYKNCFLPFNQWHNKNGGGEEKRREDKNIMWCGVWDNEPPFPFLLDEYCSENHGNI